MLTSRLPEARCWNDFDSVYNDPDAPPNGRWPNFLYHGYSRSVSFPEHSGPLSVKCVFQGAESYGVGRAHYEVDSSRYLILNAGQRYASCVGGDEETEALTVFFRPRFAEAVLASLITPADCLLDEPQRLVPGQVTFFEGMHAHGDAVSARLAHLRAASQQQVASPGWFEEQFHLLLEQLLDTHRNVCTQIEALPYKRRATRIEIYRRLHVTRDYMDANHTDKLNLNDMSRVACLSPHHFLRLFKQAFHETPHQYLMRKRLDTACRLLTMTDQPVTAICYDIGFESLSSFSNLFHYRFGKPPSLFREHASKGSR